jgi:hypothetical protein
MHACMQQQAAESSMLPSHPVPNNLRTTPSMEGMLPTLVCVMPQLQLSMHQTTKKLFR